jgi:hypothetical protein
VTYADLYQQTKIQETVYELLTQQYELAKVQEAKEIPSVKVLDVAIVPTKKSFPPRAMIVLVGTIWGIVSAMVWIAGKVRWGAVAPNDPRKIFATRVFAEVVAAIPKFPQNGKGTLEHSDGPWLWNTGDDPNDKKPEGTNRETT